MKFISLAPFVPSGSNFEGSKQLFQELGFEILWDGGDTVGFQRDNCKFILQKYENKEFAENFMVTVKVSSAQEFYDEVNGKGLVQKFGIRMNKPTEMPYGIDVSIIDIAGVCWHFVE